MLEGLVAEEPDAIRLIFRHFPVTTVHPLALQAAEAAEAAGAQRKFWEMHNLLFAHQPNFEFEHLRRLAHSIGLEMGKFDREMETHAHLPEVKEDKISRGNGADQPPRAANGTSGFNALARYSSRICSIRVSEASGER